MECNIREIVNKKKCYIMMFLFLFIMSMVVHLIIDNTTEWWDAGQYWETGKSCRWSVKNIQWGFRGWLLPYIFWLCYRFGMLFGHEFLGYQIFSSAVFSFAFTFIFAHIARMLKIKASDRKMAMSGGICGILFFVFFKGLFLYTLSDFYALVLAFMSIVLTHWIVECPQKMGVKVLDAFLLGICLYGTYNIRTIYLFSLITCLSVLIAWQLYCKRWKQLLMTASACYTGMLICAIPQYIMNYNLSGVYSWRVPTQGLMLYQLQCGIGMERYATFVGEPAQYGDAGMRFINNAGAVILDRAQITELTSYMQMVKLIFRYPLDFIGIYVRHFLNILYPIYPNQYIYDIEKDKSFFLILFYTILFLGTANFINSFRLKNNKWIWFVLILVPCVCILPGAVEIRFFIAFYFLICMYAVLGIRDFAVRFKDNKIKYVIIYFIGFLLYVAYAGILLSTTENGVATIN